MTVTKRWETAIADINSGKRTHVEFRAHYPLTDEQIGGILDAIANAPQVNHLAFDGQKISAENMQKIAAILAADHPLKQLRMPSCNIADAEGVILAQSLKKNTRLEKLSLNHNAMGDESAIAFADIMRADCNLLEMSVAANHSISAVGLEALDEAIAYGRNKNILRHFPQEVAIRTRCQENMKLATYFGEQLKADFSELPAHYLYQIYERQTSILNQTSNMNLKMKNFREYIEELPKVDWNKPLTVERLLKPVADGRTILDNPLVWKDFGKILDRLDEAGRPVRAADLLMPDKKTSSPLLDSIIDHERIDELFVPERWQGVSPQEIKAVMRVLPEDLRPSNQHALLASLRSAPKRER